MPKKSVKKYKARRAELRKMVLNGIGHDWQGRQVSFSGSKFLVGEERMAHHLRAGYKDPTLGRSKGTGGGKKGGGDDESKGGGRGSKGGGKSQQGRGGKK